MHRFLATSAALALSTLSVFAQAPAAGPAVGGAAAHNTPSVEFEMMTWPEVKTAMAAGTTTALFYTGGTEQRGPQNVNGGHNLMAKAVVKAIALKLGNAIAMPVLAYTPNNASAELPGKIGLTNDLLAAILERLAEQAIVTGFKNVVLMGDHGGGQPNIYRAVAGKLDGKYGPQGTHVYYCDDVYIKAGHDFDEWLASQGYPPSTHAGIPDTSEMMYLGGAGRSTICQDAGAQGAAERHGALCLRTVGATSDRDEKAEAPCVFGIQNTRITGSCTSTTSREKSEWRTISGLK